MFCGFLYYISMYGNINKKIHKTFIFCSTIVSNTISRRMVITYTTICIIYIYFYAEENLPRHQLRTLGQPSLKRTVETNGYYRLQIRFQLSGPTPELF